MMLNKLKSFENFVNDDNRGDGTMYPEHNIALKERARKYVEYMLHHKFEELFDILGLDMPMELQGEYFENSFDEAREEGIKYFIENPEEIKDSEVKLDVMERKGDIPRIGNIGASFRESRGRINEDKYDDEFNIDGDNEDEDDTITLKDDLNRMIEDSVNTSDIKTKEDFIESYLKDDTDTEIVGLINDSDVYEFYLKYRVEIDELLLNMNYYDESPASANVFGLYDYIVHSTKVAVKDVVQGLK